MHILLDVSSIQDLFSLIRASPRYYQVFLTAREKILITVVERDVGPELLRDAIYAARACLLDPRRSGVPDCGASTTTSGGVQVWNRKPRQTDVSDFLLAWEKRYIRGAVPQPRLLNVDEAITVAQLQRSVKTLVADYVLGYSRLQKEKILYRGDPEKASYWFAMLYHLFHDVPGWGSGSHLNPGDPNAQRFLSSLGFFKLDGYDKIHTHILDRLTSLCSRIDVNLEYSSPDPYFEVRGRRGRGDNPIDGFSRKFTEYDYFCKSYASLPLSGKLRNMISMGLGVVSRLLEASRQTEVEPFIINGDPCCSEFITRSLRLRRP